MSDQAIGFVEETKPKHSVLTRIWHWASAGAIIMLILSGLAIFNAHPRLYWGSDGVKGMPAWLEIGSQDKTGYLTIGGRTFDTTGYLGYWETRDDKPRRTAFPAAVTYPSPYGLADARGVHLTAALVLLFGWPIYMLCTVFSGRLYRDIIPARRECTPVNLWGCVKDHAQLRHVTHGNSIYNPIQKIVYMSVKLILFPLVILTGLTMSPAVVAAWPWLLDLFGGRQSARTIHFIATHIFILFIVVHIIMLLLHKPWKLFKEMTVGGRRDDDPIQEPAE